MVTRIRPQRVVALAREEVPGPVDVPNLITTSRFDRYRWYGLLVFPVMTAVGGRVLWMSRFESAIAGEQQAEKFLIVRYPSHRRFIAMTMNPYYWAINRLREAGVSRFEASFTHATTCAPELGRQRRLVGVHFRSYAGEDALPAVTAPFAAAGCELLYATRATATLGAILDPPQDTDPNPLTFGELALFALPGDDVPDVAAAVQDATEACAIAVYRRESPSTYRPF